MTINKTAKSVIGLSLVAVIGAGGIFYYQQNGVKQVNAESVELPVQTQPAMRTDIVELVSATGTVNPAEENGVYIATTQKVANVYVSLGDVVAVGDILCDYDVDYSRKALQNTLSQQQITLNNAQLNLQNLTTGLSETEVLQYESNITSAEKAILDAENSLESTNMKIAQLENDLASAIKTAEDNKKLLDVGGTTQEAYQQSLDAVTNVQFSLDEAKNSLASNELALASAQSSLEQAEKNYELAQNPLGTSAAQNNYKQQENEIAKASLVIQNVQDQLSDLTAQSTAHVEGTIVAINIEEGSIVNDETSIVKIADLNQLIVNANVSEYDAPLLALGQTVEITTDAIENSLYYGKITYISPIATVTNTFSGSETTVAIEVAIENPDGILKPGYSVDMEILVTDLADVVAVPLEAVLVDPREGNSYVFTVDADGNLKKSVVEIGATDDLYVEVKAGLSEKDIIVVAPTSEMVEGTPVDSYTASPSSLGAGDFSGDRNSQQSGGMGFGGGMPQGSGGGMPQGGSGGMPQGGGGGARP